MPKRKYETHEAGARRAHPRSPSRHPASGGRRQGRAAPATPEAAALEQYTEAQAARLLAEARHLRLLAEEARERAEEVERLHAKVLRVLERRRGSG